MDFRGADIGDFVCHCHIAEHEDGGMMTIIRVEPWAAAAVDGAGIYGFAELASRPLAIPRHSSFGHSPGGSRRAFHARHLSLYATVWMEVHE
jgi:hypothetical protein